MYLRGVEVPPGERGVLLKSQSIVQVGSSIFTFVLPSSKSAANKQDVDVSTCHIYSHLLHSLFTPHAFRIKSSLLFESVFSCVLHAITLTLYEFHRVYSFALPLVPFLSHIHLIPIRLLLLLSCFIYYVPIISLPLVSLNPFLSVLFPQTPSYQRLSLALSLKAAIEIRDLPFESTPVESQQFLLDESVRLDEVTIVLHSCSTYSATFLIFLHLKALHLYPHR